MEQGSGRATRESLLAKIDYAIVALRISETHLPKILKEVPRVNGKMPGFDALQTFQLEAIWKRLSNHPGWRKGTECG